MLFRAFSLALLVLTLAAPGVVRAGDGASSSVNVALKGPGGHHHKHRTHGKKHKKKNKKSKRHNRRSSRNRRRRGHRGHGF